MSSKSNPHLQCKQQHSGGCCMWWCRKAKLVIRLVTVLDPLPCARVLFRVYQRWCQVPLELIYLFCVRWELDSQLTSLHQEACLNHSEMCWSPSVVHQSSSVVGVCFLPFRRRKWILCFLHMVVITVELQDHLSASVLTLQFWLSLSSFIMQRILLQE